VTFETLNAHFSKGSVSFRLQASRLLSNCLQTVASGCSVSLKVSVFGFLFYGVCRDYVRSENEMHLDKMSANKMPFGKMSRWRRKRRKLVQLFISYQHLI
jgi:hypothetical protein